MSYTNRLLALTVVLLIVPLCFAGCFRTTLILNEGRAEAWPKSQTTRMHVVGLVDLDGSVHLGMCETGTARVEQVMGGFSILVAYASGGAVTMRQAKVYCLDGAEKGAWFGEDGLVYSEEEVRSMELISGMTNAL